MKIHIHNSFLSRGQMAEIVSRLISEGRSLPDAANFSKKFLEAAKNPGTTEMHVFLSMDELIHTTVSRALKNQLRQDIVHVVRQIKHHGYYVAALQLSAGKDIALVAEMATA